MHDTHEKIFVISLCLGLSGWVALAGCATSFSERARLSGSSTYLNLWIRFTSFDGIGAKLLAT